ncbi:uncharacterized protein AKAME5_001894500 [Lates japonicus]|uniref:TERF1-interacting nuclear factor 2 N-terminal domain-containing protein n=1 Tax=Lates japonicus TaxID=270547 RepID=A0AAD3RG10_LATJO|nr:uncharacterized protein AKAME5_001894500 [Lates japonicus]
METRDCFIYYLTKQMEEHYGEHYAQKVEERLLHYLHQLETMLPGDTFIDKILQKNSPVTEEEKLLLEVVTSDSKTIATTLRKPLHCDVASCRPDQVSQSLEHGENEMESSQLSKSVLVVSSPKALHKSVEGKTPLQFQSKVLKRGEEALQGVSKDSCLLWKDDSHSDITRRQQTKEHGKVEEGSSNKGKQETSERSREFVQETPSFPQFCSRHQRWVKSILQECPDECSEELLLQADVSSSPPLFQSSLSTTSSQDLTPSDLVPCPPDQQDPPSQTSTHPQTAVQVSEHVNLKDQSSGSAINSSETESLPQPSSTLFSPIVRLIDFVSTFKLHQASRDKDSSFDQLKSAAPANHPATMYNVSQSCPRLSRELRQTVTNSFSQNPSAEQFTKASSDLSVSTHDASTSTSQSGTLVSQNSIKPYPPTHTSSPFPLNTQPHSIVVSSSSFSDSLAVRSETCRVHRAQLRLSLQSQAVPLQSTLLQPYVSLTRLSAQECYRVTKGRSSAGHVEPALQGSSDDERKKEEGDSDSSFDLNTLYSSQSSGGDSEDSLIYDPDYKPCVKKKRLLLKYETAKSLNHT